MLLRAVRVVHRWVRKRGQAGLPTGFDNSSKAARVFRSALSHYDWTCDGAECVWRGGSVLVLGQSAGFDKGLHAIRTAWRKIRFDRWLASDRRDASLASDIGIVFDDPLLGRIHKPCMRSNGDAAAVMLGGLPTDATR